MTHPTVPDAATAKRGESGDEQVPRVLGNTGELLGAPTPSGADVVGGAVWRLEPSRRQLDANLIRLAPDDRIDPHVGPEQDVLLHVLAGSGRVELDGEAVDLTEGAIAWLPRRSRRAIIAGSDGLSYLSVHVRRPGLSIGVPGPSDDAP